LGTHWLTDDKKIPNLSRKPAQQQQRRIAEYVQSPDWHSLCTTPSSNLQNSSSCKFDLVSLICSRKLLAKDGKKKIPSHLMISS